MTKDRWDKWHSYRDPGFGFAVAAGLALVGYGLWHAYGSKISSAWNDPRAPKPPFGSYILTLFANESD